MYICSKRWNIVFFKMRKPTQPVDSLCFCMILLKNINLVIKKSGYKIEININDMKIIYSTRVLMT